jgi:hypothetical protein
VTVISCSYNDMRVVQGVVDFANQSVEIRKSPIVTVYGSLEAMWQKFCIFLGWLLAMPFGGLTP